MRRDTGTARWARRMTGPMAALLGATVMLGGCGAVKEGVAEVTAKQTLLGSVPDGSEGPFRFTGKDVTTDVSGSVDPAAKALDLKTSIKDPEHGFSTHITFRVIGDEAWTKISFTETKGLTGLPKLPKKWLKLDPSKFTDADGMPKYDGADQGNAGPLIEAATTVNDDGAGKYSGTIDLTSGEAAKVLEADQMTALGDAAKQVPFTAVVGADKNLASLTLAVPAAGSAKAFSYIVKYQDYGSAPKVTAPTAAQAQNAPAVAYELLNG
ncbi:hypothetical protein I0C86_36320 [Plantactinospora sp. S1510]|uniref:Lipoprotein n=1 Tax=Plantactinospora alkalitolerans TaxID=2789879 RepID=A0ABS0H7B1_9ACTN|nr:hypothetical protein [Plantactinospora alkalitolerans]MBF9134357.1 hypothetical protein [Plantactinospora alkalitolerans]